MARSQYDWEFIRPLDQAANIASLTQGNQQVNAGIAAMGQAVGDYADALKQRNTDEILNTLMRAQTSADLPNAMNAVQALQQQYGRGYDQSAVRNAIDTRGSTLAARDLQNINLQNAQAAQAAIPQLNALYASRLQQANATPEQLAAFNAIQGVDLSQQAQQMVGDLRDTRDFNYRKGVNDRDYNYKVQQDLIQQDQWNKSFGLQQQNANINAVNALMPEAGTTTQTIDANGNVTTVANPTKLEAFMGISDLMGNIVRTESGFRHTDSKGNLTRSPKGALGIAQIMPATAAKPGYGMQPINLQTTTPDQQVAWANQYIQRIAKAHNFTTEQAVAAYNAGPGAVQDAIKKGGANWLSKLPKETRDYVPKVLGGSKGSTTTQASAAVKGITPQALTEVRSAYNTAIDKATAAYNSSKAASQQKGSIAGGSKGVDAWLAGKKEFSFTKGGLNPIITKSNDIVAMAKNNKVWSSLPEEAKVNILEGTYNFVNSTALNEYVPNQSVKNFIDNRAKEYIKNQTATFKASQDAALNSAITALQRKYQDSGATPPDRKQALKLINPTLYEQMYGKKKK